MLARLRDTYISPCLTPRLCAMQVVGMFPPSPANLAKQLAWAKSAKQASLSELLAPEALQSCLLHDRSAPAASSSA